MLRKIIYTLIVMSCLPVVVLAAGKKGFGLPERAGYDERQLEALHVSWYYNWGATSAYKTKVLFVPMAYSPKHIAEIAGHPPVVLGFNEPDNANQANLEVDAALAVWPQLLAKSQLVVAPATAHNPALKDGWLHTFVEKGGRADYIAVHWYKGADVKKFIADMKEIYALYHKPIWVTEFACQTAADSHARPTHIVQKEIDRFIAETTRWMNSTEWIQCYAWHDSKEGTSALFKNGQLTATGEAYASVEP
jgi:Glycosyl hydrolase catalytic core